MSNYYDLAETFILVADSGSIYQAATKLNQTSAAISKKLSKLETHLGIQLLIRGRKGVTLTEAGQSYYHEVKQAVQQFKAAELSAKQLKSEPQGELVVVSNRFYAENKILPKLGNFLKKYPGILLRLEVADMLPDFNSRKIDILFGVSAPGSDGLVQKKIAETHYVLCASPEYLNKYGEPKNLAELLQHNFIAHSGRKLPNRIHFAKQDVLLQPKLFFNDTSLMIQAAQEGLGIIWTHKNMVDKYLTTKSLKCILEKFTADPINVYAYYIHQRFREPKIQAFLSFFS
jgi:DNA-binding transcriptional LysR family regulator